MSSVLCKLRGDHAAGVAACERSLAISVDALGADSVDVATVHHNLGAILHAADPPGAAEVHARRAVAIRASALGGEPPAAVADRSALAAILIDLGELDEASQLLEAGFDFFIRRYGKDHLDVATCFTTSARAQHAGATPAKQHGC